MGTVAAPSRRKRRGRLQQAAALRHRRPPRFARGPRLCRSGRCAAPSRVTGQCCALDEGPTVVDSDHHCAAVGNIGYLDTRTDWQRARSGGQFIGVLQFTAAGGPPAQLGPYHDAVTTWAGGAALNGAAAGAGAGTGRVIVEHPESKRSDATTPSTTRPIIEACTCCTLHMNAHAVHPCSMQNAEPIANLYPASLHRNIWAGRVGLIYAEDFDLPDNPALFYRWREAATDSSHHTRTPGMSSALLCARARWPSAVKLGSTRLASSGLAAITFTKATLSITSVRQFSRKVTPSTRGAHSAANADSVPECESVGGSSAATKPCTCASCQAANLVLITRRASRYYASASFSCLQIAA
jgi:hypothetical protein